MDNAELQNRFKYHPADSMETQGKHLAVRTRCGELAEFLNTVVPSGREKQIAMEHLEEVMYWANAAIARQA